MDASTVRRVLDLIPERVARMQSGSAFAADSPCRYPERVAHVARFLHWLSPLEVLAKEDQQVLGLLNAAGRPVHAADLEEEAADEGQDELVADEGQDDLAAESDLPYEEAPAPAMEDPRIVEVAVA